MRPRCGPDVAQRQPGCSRAPLSHGRQARITFLPLQVRAMAKLSVQKSKAERSLAAMQSQLKKVGEDKAALFGEVSSLETQLAQAHADREEARVWANTYREMLVKVA